MDRLREELPEIFRRILGETLSDIGFEDTDERLDILADGSSIGSLPRPFPQKEISLVIGTTHILSGHLFNRASLRRIAWLQTCALDGLVTVAALHKALNAGYALWWMQSFHRDERSHFRRATRPNRRDWDNMAKIILLSQATDLDALVRERDHAPLRNARLFLETPREIAPDDAEELAMKALRWVDRFTASAV